MCTGRTWGGLKCSQNGFATQGVERAGVRTAPWAYPHTVSGDKMLQGLLGVLLLGLYHPLTVYETWDGH